MKLAALLVATCGYAGYFPVAPGTVGSAVGLVVYAVLRATLPGIGFEAAAIAAVFGAGTWAATAAERHFGKKDPGPVVIDEVLGMLVTLAFLGVGLSGAIVGFFLFRVFDIIKPYPAGKLEDLPRGLGVMADDAMAGLYAHVALRACIWAAPQWVA